MVRRTVERPRGTDLRRRSYLIHASARRESPWRDLAFLGQVRRAPNVGLSDRRRSAALLCEGMKVRDLIRLLETSGWRLKAVKGSHRQFRHPDKGLVVTVPGHPGKDIPVGTLKAILRSAGLERKEED